MNRLTLLERINRKLALQFALPMLVLFFLSALAGGIAIHQSVERSLDNQLRQRADVAVHSAQFAVESANTIGTIQRFIAALGAEDEFISVTVIAGDPLRIIASTHLENVGKTIGDLGNNPDLMAVLLLAQNQRQRSHIRFLKDRYLFGQSLNILGTSENGAPLGQGAVALEMDLHSYQSAKADISSTLLLVILLLLAIILLSSLFLLHRLIITPQKQLLTVLERRKNNEKTLCAVSGENEISAITQSLNELFVVNDQVDELKNQFVSTVSHELRTPLTSIRGALGLVLGAFSANLDPKAKELLATADRNAEQLARLINDLLDLEKMASGKMAFQLELTELGELAQEAVNNIEPYAIKHKIQVHLKTPPDLHHAWVDKNRMIQALFNLLSNAIKFSKEGQPVILTLTEHESFFQFSVKDYGRGIPDEFRARMFSRFAQADSRDSREKGGTGLGLNIVQAIVGQHGGRVDFFSEHGKGTEFFIQIPKVSTAGN